MNCDLMPPNLKQAQMWRDKKEDLQKLLDKGVPSDWEYVPNDDFGDGVLKNILRKVVVEKVELVNDNFEGEKVNRFKFTTESGNEYSSEDEFEIKMTEKLLETMKINRVEKKEAASKLLAITDIDEAEKRRLQQEVEDAMVEQERLRKSRLLEEESKKLLEKQRLLEEKLIENKKNRELKQRRIENQLLEDLQRAEEEMKKKLAEQQTQQLKLIREKLEKKAKKKREEYDGEKSVLENELNESYARSKKIYSRV